MKAGIKNRNAWAVAGVPYQDPATGNAPTSPEEMPLRTPQKTAEKVAGFNLRPALVLMKGPGDDPFVISSRRPQPQAQALQPRDLALSAVGCILIIAGLRAILRLLP